MVLTRVGDDHRGEGEPHSPVHTRKLRNIALGTLLPNCGIQPFFRTVAVGRWIWPQARLSRLGFSLLNSSPGVFSSFPCSSSQILYFFIRIQSPSSMLGHHCEKCSLDTESADEDDELDGDKGSDPKVLTLCFPRFFVLLLDP